MQGGQWFGPMGKITNGRDLRELLLGPPSISAAGTQLCVGPRLCDEDPRTLQHPSLNQGSKRT